MAEEAEEAGTGGAGEEDSGVITAWQEGTPWALVAPAAASSAVDSRVNGATGADTSPRRPSQPREDDQTREVRAAPSSSPADEGTAPADGLAPSRAAEAPLNLFAAGAGLTKNMDVKPRRQKPSKARIEHLLVVARGPKQPPAKLEAREPAAGVSLRRPGSRGHIRRAGAGLRSPRDRSRPWGNQP